ncbi:MAG: hypothetical protein H7Y43_11350 [Akkermansiaceae bacterium]|nr:hypothetical protein [Verrucomicrobiales bacterium]
MINKLLETLTGKDDLERVAYKESLSDLTAYLKSRRLLIPQRPKRFLDASCFTQEQLLEMIRKETESITDDPFEPWILELDGKKRLPAFSSQKKMEMFSEKISMQLDKVFALGGAEFLIEDVTRGLDIDFVDLNLFSHKSWEIGVRKNSVG